MNSITLHALSSVGREHTLFAVLQQGEATPSPPTQTSVSHNGSSSGGSTRKNVRSQPVNRTKGKRKTEEAVLHEAIEALRDVRNNRNKDTYIHIHT